MFAIECLNVNKSFKEGVFYSKNKKVTTAVDNVSFKVLEGETFGILGPNGSGKSTLIRMLSTLLIQDSGEIKIFGYDIKKDAVKIREILNRVSVEASFFKKLSPLENLSYSSKLYGMNSQEIRKKSIEILNKLGFKEKHLNESIQDLSRGQQQKVAIARAFLTIPKLLLLDEPTTGLDPVSKRDVQFFLKEIKKEHNTTVILTTHDMVEAEQLCDRIAIIHDGKISALDTPNGLKSKIISKNGSHSITLEEVFFEITGKNLKDNELEEAS
ncbi:MAG: ABC transporter ATP-binding protein [Candidatus Sericytochromatia bacterium]